MSDIQGNNQQMSPQIEEPCCSVVGLRQYTTKPGQRDTLIALFDEHFVEGQERYGARILGQFRHRTNPDLFVWLRGFANMEERLKALTGFYFGPIWQEHRNAANYTILDSDNVLLLKPARAASRLPYNPAARPAMNAPESDGGLIIATAYPCAAPVETTFVEFFAEKIAPTLSNAGAKLLGHFVTEASANTFPQLPVREGEYVFIWLASFANGAAYQAYQTALAQDQDWRTAITPTLRKWLAKSPEVLELLPTRRSLLRHHAVIESTQ